MRASRLTPSTRRSRACRPVAAALATLACLAPLAAPARAQQRDTTPTARVIMLGTGTPILDARHSGNSVGILVRRALYVFDAGPGVERRMLEAVDRGVRFDTVPAVFITHLHSDHTLGLPALLYDHGANARFAEGGPLTVFGPPGIAAMMQHLRAAWSADRDIRLRNNDGIGNSLDARTTEIGAPGVIYRDSNVVVSAFVVPHTIWPHAYGYRVEAGGRTIVISGDERPSDATVTACNGCDVLVHEVYSAEGFKKIPPKRQAYHAYSHTSTYELADIATRARPKLLVLYHQLYFGGTTDDDLVREVKSRYAGAVVSARDLEIF